MKTRSGMLPLHGVTRRAVVGALAQAVILTACTARSPMPGIPYAAPQTGGAMRYSTGKRLVQPALPTAIKHVVIVFQENRTPDFLFQGIPGADVRNYGFDSRGNKIPLRAMSLKNPFNPHHDHWFFVQSYGGGKMNGFDKGYPESDRLKPFTFGVQSEIQPYQDMAKQYVLGDHMFETNAGPSFPAHLYIISGTATDATMKGYFVRDNTFNIDTGKGAVGGCESSKKIVTWTISAKDGSSGPAHWSCYDRPVLSDFLDAKGISWRYYQEGSGPGLWHAFNAIAHVRYGSDWANIVPSSAQFLSDVKAGKLAGVSWVMPADNWSDHPFDTGSAEGPAWVAAIVNTIGKSQYWKNTAILVTWDDWGGFYDHVAPPQYNGYELGFRVPLLVIAPYAKKGYVSKVQHEFGSLLAFTEKTFGIRKGALESTDVRADDLRDAFNFLQTPRPFVPIKAPPFNPKPLGGVTNDEDP